MIKKKSKTTKNEHTMKDLFIDKSTLSTPQAGEMIEGKIIKKSNNSVIIDLGPIGTGVIYGGELKEIKGVFKSLKVGQTISGIITDPENEDGYVELSIKEANLEKSWNDLKQKQQDDETIEVRINEANRGGLVIEAMGIIGFLPVSQLSIKNYPRVEGGDKNKILTELNKFIGKEIKVKIISLDQKREKLIVSEKAIEEKEIKESLKNYEKGDIVEGTVSGLTNFGAFIKFGDNLEGLIHISEIDWQLIDHPSQIIKENEKIKAQIININGKQVFLSLKALKQDPWNEIEKKYKNGQIIEGTVTKLNSFGALVRIADDKIYGLSHISEFSKQNQQMENVLKVNQSYDFEILSLEPQSHKMFLALKK
ncbi:30S ribosomal protein S1 [Patescibacteria group bacterium]